MGGREADPVGQVESGTFSWPKYHIGIPAITRPRLVNVMAPLKDRRLLSEPLKLAMIAPIPIAVPPRMVSVIPPAIILRLRRPYFGPSPAGGVSRLLPRAQSGRP